MAWDAIAAEWRGAVNKDAIAEAVEISRRPNWFADTLDMFGEVLSDMDKEHVIGEIRRTATANGGVVLGRKRFEAETGISQNDWYGRFWARWSDAVREAGFEPNSMNKAHDHGFLLEKLVSLTRRLGRAPVAGDLMLASREDIAFPSKNVFERLGTKRQRASLIVAFCADNPGHDDVAEIWKAIAITEPSLDDDEIVSVPRIGYVYLLKHGSRREYKIGGTYNPIRREGEISLQLPEKSQPIHYIETDDPVGIETYWHSRYAIKRKEGEWFVLSSEDVRAFKRWKRIY